MFTFHQVTLKCYITWPWARKNDIPLLLLGDLNARHPIWDKNCKAPNKNGTILEDIMSWHNVQIQNDQNSTYVHKRGSSTIDLVLTSGISDLKCQTKEFGLMYQCCIKMFFWPYHFLEVKDWIV